MHFVKPGKMILLIHDEMFQDKFNGEQNLLSFIRKLIRGYKFENPDAYEDNGTAD